MLREAYKLEVQPGRMTTVKMTGPVKGRGSGVVLAHGMNNHLDHELLVSFAEHLAERGRTVVRFNFLYRDEGRNEADSNSVLLATQKNVYDDAVKRWSLNTRETFMCGKSLGARISARNAGTGTHTAGLIYLGFPLHPPGQPEKVRKGLIYGVGDKPQLFFAGTMDPLCPLDTLKDILAGLDAPHILHAIEGGDHSFVIQEDDSRSMRDVYQDIAVKAGDWLDEISPLSR